MGKINFHAVLGIVIVIISVTITLSSLGCRAEKDFERGASFTATTQEETKNEEVVTETIHGKKFVLLLSDDVNPEDLAITMGARFVGKVSSVLGNYYEYEMPIGVDLGDITERSRHSALNTRSGTPDIIDIMQQEPKKRYSRSLGAIPAPGSINGIYTSTLQWHISEKGNADAHVLSAWNRGFFGQDSTVVIVDDGLDKRHPDIERSYAPDASANFNSGDPRDPSPSGNYAHGTAAAGVAVGSGKESPPKQPMCGHGVAPFANAGGIKLICEPVADSDEARALSFSMDIVDVYSCSWGPPDDATVLDAPGPLTVASINAVSKRGRKNGEGSAFVWAAGNGGSINTGDTCGHDGYAGNPNVIAVGALAHNGVAAYYSEACPSLFVCAPSSGDGWSIATSDVSGFRGATTNDCRSDFGGTSAAAPFVAGVLALMFSANPALSSRDAYRIVAATSRVVDQGDPSWKRNAAGIWHSDRYGFGLIDADAAVVLSMDWVKDQRRVESSWSSSQPATSCCGIELPNTLCSNKIGRVTSSSTTTTTVEGTIAYPCDIPDKSRGKSYAIASTVQVGVSDDNTAEQCHRSMERLVVVISATHSKRGDLQFTIISPSGSLSVFKGRTKDKGTTYNLWNFTSVSHWGEDPIGEWKLVVEDTVPSNRGKLEHFEIFVTGTTLCE